MLRDILNLKVVLQHFVNILELISELVGIVGMGPFVELFLSSLPVRLVESSVHSIANLLTPAVVIETLKLMVDISPLLFNLRKIIVVDLKSVGDLVGVLVELVNSFSQFLKKLVSSWGTGISIKSSVKVVDLRRLAPLLELCSDLVPVRVGFELLELNLNVFPLGFKLVLSNRWESDLDEDLIVVNHS